jgi:prepilin signal peptidase PulO-like enzyme (type II secretory pathway)
MDMINFVIEIILAIVFGAVFGSYATLFAYRLPRGESCFGRYFGKKSRCPKCNSTIITRDLIPLLNWLFTLGACRFCKTKIPRIHLFVELTTTILFVVCYLQFGFSEKFIIYSLISVSLVILMACDFTHRVFPKEILIFLMVLVIISRVLEEHTTLNMANSLILGVIASAIFYRLIGNKFPEIFTGKTQLNDYIKFILIACLAMKTSQFILFFFTVLLILTLLIAEHFFTKKNKISFGYALIIPFIGLLIFANFNF